MDENTVLVKEQECTEAIAFLQITDSARDRSDTGIWLTCPGNGAGKAKRCVCEGPFPMGTRMFFYMIGRKCRKN